MLVFPKTLIVLVQRSHGINVAHSSRTLCLRQSLHASRTERVDLGIVLLWELAVLPTCVQALGWKAIAGVRRAEFAMPIVALDHLVGQVISMPADQIGCPNSSPVTHRTNDRREGGGCSECKKPLTRVLSCRITIDENTRSPYLSDVIARCRLCTCPFMRIGCVNETSYLHGDIVLHEETTERFKGKAIFALMSGAMRHTIGCRAF